MNIITEPEIWLHCQLSIARFYGAIKVNGMEYFVVKPTNDLVRKDYLPLYKKLGRDKLKKYIAQGLSAKEIRIKINEKENGSD